MLHCGPIEFQLEGICSTVDQYNASQKEYSYLVVPLLTNRMPVRGNMLHSGPIECQ
jgi:hypothetical protein